MNTAALTRHLLLKDLRYQRGWIVLLWLVASMLPRAICFAEGLGRNESVYLITSLCGGRVWLIMLGLIRIIRIDAPGREFHFLATRPVPWRVLLAGKGLFIAMFLLLPVWLVKIAVVHVVKIPVNFLDVVLLLAQNAICVGAFFAVVILFSLFLRSMPAIFAAMIGAAVVVAYGAVFVRELSRHHGVLPGLANIALDDCRLLMCFLVIGLTACVVAFFRYRSKSTVGPLCILAAGLAASALRMESLAIRSEPAISGQAAEYRGIAGAVARADQAHPEGRARRRPE